MKGRGLSRCQAFLLGKLGDPYRANRIDGACCIYRDFGDYDVEICSGRTKRALYHIFIWRKKPVMKIVERYSAVHCGRNGQHQSDGWFCKCRRICGGYGHAEPGLRNA